MITAAMAWCNGYAVPLLVPLNGWLQLPLPLQIRALTCPQGAKLIEIAPSGQHIVIVPSELSSQCDAQLWHVMVICLWSLENFKLLNNIIIPSSINTVDISSDSVFLLAACDDEKLYLRSLATGTEIHTLRGHQEPIESICLAKDCRRVIAGGIDGSISVFDMHSGKLIRSLSANLSADVTSVKVTDKDDFLVTASGNRVIYWSFRDEDIPKLNKTKNHHKQEQTIQQHTASITCIDIFFF